SRIVVMHTRIRILISFPPSFDDSWTPGECRARAPGHLSPVGAPRAVSPRAAGAYVPAMGLTPNLLGQGPWAPHRTAPGATALGPRDPCRQRRRRQGAHGEPHRSEPSSAVLASWATSTARFPDTGAV